MPWCSGLRKVNKKERNVHTEDSGGYFNTAGVEIDTTDRSPSLLLKFLGHVKGTHTQRWL